MGMTPVRSDRAPPEAEPEWFPGDFYPREVWDFLAPVVPGLLQFWSHKMKQKHDRCQRAIEQLELRGPLYYGSGMTHDKRMKEIAEDSRLGVRTLDLYIWAVLLGNTELATELLGATQDPMRAALLGARLCNHMADVLPIETDQLTASAQVHENFAIELLDLCENQLDAACMLLAPARHWERNVLELAVHSEMKDFTAHRHVQNLITRNMHGDIDYGFVTQKRGDMGIQNAECRSMLPAHFERDPQMLDALYLLAHTVCPIVLTLRPSPSNPARKPLVIDFYRIPYVKMLLRKTMYQLYVVLFSVVVMDDKVPLLTEVTLGALRVRPPVLLAVWTVSLILDEWNQWVVAPSTFEIDLWNTYDYINLFLTSLALTIDLLVVPFVEGTLRLGPLSWLLHGGGGEGGGGEGGGGLGRLLGEAAVAVVANATSTGVTSSPSLAVPGAVPLPRLDEGVTESGSWFGRALRGGGGGSHSHDYAAETGGGVAGGLKLETVDEHLLAVVNVLIWCRVLQHYSTQREIGVLIIMIIEMAADMKKWILLTFIFMLAFAVTFVAIADEDTDMMDSLVGPVWAPYGEFDLEGTAHSSGYTGATMLWIYVMISNILLVNLLIAMMSDTYAEIKEKADVEWKFARVGSVLEAVDRTHAVPPPFNLPILACRFVMWGCKRCFGGGKGANQEEAPDDRDAHAHEWRVGGRLYNLKRRREKIAKRLLQKHRRHKEDEKTTSSEGRLERIEMLITDLLKFAEDQERELKTLKEEVIEEKQADEKDRKEQKAQRAREDQEKAAGGRTRGAVAAPGKAKEATGGGAKKPTTTKV